MHKNKTGICITTYNNSDIIHGNIKSALEQKASHDIVVYVVDDGSTDGTPDILKQLKKHHPTLKVCLSTHLERGITRSKAINMAISDECDYILFVDSDMILAQGLIEKCVVSFSETGASALVIPEKPYSEHENFMTKVKLFERELLNNVGEDLEVNSVEGARFWKTSEYLRSGGLNPDQISFEETQPTIRIIEKGGIVKRATKTHIYHNEGRVTFINLMKKKYYYFSKLQKTISSEKKGLMKTLSRWYFFRPYLYSKNSISLYIKNPLKFIGIITMYIGLTIAALIASLSSDRKLRFLFGRP